MAWLSYISAVLKKKVNNDAFQSYFILFFGGIWKTKREKYGAAFFLKHFFPVAKHSLRCLITFAGVLFALEAFVLVSVMTTMDNIIARIGVITENACFCTVLEWELRQETRNCHQSN